MNNKNTKKDNVLSGMFHMFTVFFRIGMFTIGGGYAMVPVMEAEFVSRSKLITQAEFTDVLAVSQSLPGVLAINSSSYIGYKLYGLKGAIVGCIGTALPSFIIIIVVAKFFDNFMQYSVVNSVFNGLRPAIVGTIIYAFYKMAISLNKTWINFFVVVLTVALITFLHVHPVFVIIGGGIMGYLLYGLKKDDKLD